MIIGPSRLLLAILSIFTLGAECFAQNDSTIFQYDVFHFGSADYRASLTNNDLIFANDGLIYVANLNGVLEYDGSEWRILELPGYSLASCLMYDRERDLIYVGSTNEFGYFKKNYNGVREYHSMRYLIDSVERIPDIDQIINFGDDIYFVSSKNILKWDGENIKVISQKNAWLLKLEGQILVTVLDKGLAYLNDDSLVFFDERTKWERDQFLTVTSLSKHTYLLGSFKLGIYLLDIRTNSIIPWHTDAGEYAKRNYTYDIASWKDSLTLISTVEGGLIISDNTGNILDTLSSDDGMSSDNLGFIFSGPRDNIWTLGYFGIDLVRLTDNIPFDPGIEPQLRFISINDKEMPSNEVSEIGMAPIDLAFHFSFPSWHSDDIEYSYYLEGFDDSWSEWSRMTNKKYEEMSYGEYTFYLKARSGGVESGTIKKSISIPIPWYKSIYTYLVAAIILSVFILAIIRLVTNQLKRRNRKLEEIVQDRTSELRKTNTELQIANTELDNFVYRSSHDLVAPLKSLKGLISVAQFDTDNQPEYFDKMNSRIEKLEDFIKSIMDYSVNSKRDIVKERIKLDDVIEEIVQDLKYYKNAERVELIRDYDPGLELHTDTQRISIVLSNLITNSVKYHNYNQNSPTVKVSVSQENSFQKIQIIDNGRGIDQKYLNKIFDMFFRASNDSEGSGLGLYIVKDTINKIGGEIDVASAVNSGTTFTISLPIN